MRYAQIHSGQKMHLVYEAGEGEDPASLVPAGELSIPLCGISNFNHYRMTINVPLGNACKNCQRVYKAKHR